MVYLVIDGEGGRDAANAARASTATIWAGADVFTPHEQNQFRNSGLNLSIFNYSLKAATQEALADALATIEVHHPGETIWVQQTPQRKAATNC